MYYLLPFPSWADWISDIPALINFLTKGAIKILFCCQVRLGRIARSKLDTWYVSWTATSWREVRGSDCSGYQRKQLSITGWWKTVRIMYSMSLKPISWVSGTVCVISEPWEKSSLFASSAFASVLSEFSRISTNRSIRDWSSSKHNNIAAWRLPCLTETATVNSFDFKKCKCRRRYRQRGMLFDIGSFFKVAIKRFWNQES